MMWPSHVKKVLSTLNIEHPLIQAPMAGLTSAKLVAAVSNAGGLGSLGGALLSPEQLQKAIQEIRTLTKNPFAVNLFAPTSPMKPTESQVQAMNILLDRYREELNLPLSPTIQFGKSTFEEQLAIILQENPPVFSFTFNSLSFDIIRKLKQAGMIVIGTATTVPEGLALEKIGVDMIVAQGYEAGGHRGTFPEIEIDDALIGEMALLPQLKNAVKIPLIASGGIMNGNGILAALMLGASVVQMGTAFLTCTETTIHSEYKETLLNTVFDQTHLTRAFTGRYARAIKNRFSLEMNPYQDQFLAYPFQRKLTADIKTKAAEVNNPELMSLWAGQAASLCEAKSAGELVNSLIGEIKKTLAEWK